MRKRKYSESQTEAWLRVVTYALESGTGCSRVSYSRSKKKILKEKCNETFVNKCQEHTASRLVGVLRATLQHRMQTLENNTVLKVPTS